jgi:tRNA A-37 threonylcarbamoyl transferase component Bud32
LEAGEGLPALECLIGVARQDDRYRPVAIQVFDIALKNDFLDILVQNFLLPFLRSGPTNDDEADTFLLLSQLYATNQLPHLAQEALEQILARTPGDERALAALHQLVGPLPSSWRPEAAPIVHEPHRNEAPTIIDEARTAEESTAWDTQVDSGEQKVPASVEVADPGRPEGALPRFEADRPEMVNISVGTVVADRYELIKLLGTGGMGTVFQAIDGELDEEVALKALRPKGGLGRDDSRNVVLHRFKQELKVCRQLRHRNLVELYEFGVHQGVHFLTMELLVGETLDEQLGEPLPLSLGLDYLRQVCAGLQVAHDWQIVHRDIKPANLFILRDGTVKVMDFGIAKSRQAGQVTNTGLLLGSPMYMAPEQVTGSPPVSPATDLYALGVVAYEMFTGAPPSCTARSFP